MKGGRARHGHGGRLVRAGGRAPGPVALLLAAGCASLVASACASAGDPPGSAGGGGGRTETPAAAGDLIRRIEPFTVRDADGRPYQMPFLGGFNVPRPQWVDVDGDGDLDLFVQEYTDRLMFFERLPDEGGEHRYAHHPNRFRDLAIGEWYRFVDVDGDADPDLLAEEPFSFIRLYLNRGVGSHPPDFELVADTLRDASGAPLFSDRQNIPNAADIDCDGRLDLLVGRLTGTITRFEATGPLGRGEARFEKVTDRFEGIEIVGQGGPGLPPGGATMHGANTMALADIDGDGDVDLFWGDFFEPGLLLIENRGSCDAPDFTAAPRPFPLHDPVRTSGYNAATFGDADGDGDLDLLMGVLGGAFNANTTTAENLLHFEQDAQGRPVMRTRRYITQIDVGIESVPALLDVDGDGDLDLVVSNKIDPDDLSTSRLHVFESVGSPGAPAFRRGGTLDVQGAYHNVPAFGDLDGDRRPDLVLGTWRDELRYFRNEAGPDGRPRFVIVDSAFVTLTRGSNATPALGDLDGDGDLDLLVGESSGHINFYRNEGGPSSPRFVLVGDEWGGIKAERRSAPALVDWDGDGDLDLLLGTEREGVRLFLNEVRGGGEEPRFVETDPLLPPDRAPNYSVPLPADLDGDGDLDLVVGGVGGGLYYFERAGAP